MVSNVRCNPAKSKKNIMRLWHQFGLVAGQWLKNVPDENGLLLYCRPGEKMYNLPKILVTIGSCASIAFGVWHFFVPSSWKWYSYIDPNAAELVLAVRAINVFFSLALVLFGVLNILFLLSNHSNRFSIIAMLVAASILWLTRLAFQVIYPQGSMYPGLQYGLLAAFAIIFLCYFVSLIVILAGKNSF